MKRTVFYIALAALVSALITDIGRAETGRFSALIQAAALATNPSPPPSPVPPPPNSQVCPDCDGTGRVGDGTVERPCKACNGTGKLTTASADAQATPWPGVAAMLEAAKPTGNEVLVDPGCGADCRVLIEARKYYPAWTGKAIGIELDPISADAARRAVAAAGYSDSIQVITGDATVLETPADVVVTYMWPSVLERLRPRFARAKRWISYAHAVPGLTMRQVGDVYVYDGMMTVPVVTRRSAAVYRGRTYTGPVCGNPRCSMCNAIRQQLNTTVITGYKQVPVAQEMTVRAAPRYTAVRVKHCSNGRCWYSTEWRLAP